eukprot:2745265-Rhodomonas_salina.5
MERGPERTCFQPRGAVRYGPDAFREAITRDPLAIARYAPNRCVSTGQLALTCGIKGKATAVWYNLDGKGGCSSLISERNSLTYILLQPHAIQRRIDVTHRDNERLARFCTNPLYLGNGSPGVSGGSRYVSVSPQRLPIRLCGLRG